MTATVQADAERLCLVACSDDYLLEGALGQVAARVCTALGVAEPETLSDETTPEAVAVEVFSPSLFSPQRVLVVPDALAWVDAPPPQAGSGRPAKVDVGPLVQALEQGVPEGMALILGVWCARQPKGPLAELVVRRGQLTWIGLPPPPKPWEQTIVSAEQAAVLRDVLRSAAPGVRFAAAAERLLLDRLGFAPRQLAQEAHKLATAAGPAGTVDEALVRQLTFPRERSLEVVRDAVLRREVGAILDLLAAAAGGAPVRGWRGERLDLDALPLILVGQVAGLLVRLLYLRRVAVELGVAAAMDPRQTRERRWYGSRFKGKAGSELSRYIGDDPGAPWPRSGRGPSEWALGQLFAGAGRYRDRELAVALDAAGRIEVAVRGPGAPEAVSAWLAGLIQA